METGPLENRYFTIVRTDWSQHKLSEEAQHIFTSLYEADYANGCRWQETPSSIAVFCGKARPYSQLASLQRFLDKLNTELRDFKYKYNPANKGLYAGKFAHHTLSLAHGSKGFLQLVIECDNPLPGWRDSFLTKVLGDGKITPVLHTPSLIKQPDGTYIEVWDQSHLEGREFFDLTGHGEAEALRLLAVFCAGVNRRLESSAIPRMTNVEKALEDGNLVWFGSCFNPLHGLRQILDNEDFWRSGPPSCILEGFSDHVEVSYPGTPKIITNRWPPVMNLKEPERSYSLVRSVLTVHGTRITIAAGTSTDATLRAARSLLGIKKYDLNRLAQIRDRADAQSQFEVLFETTPGRLSPKTRLVWPNPNPKEGDSITEHEHTSS